MKRETFIEIALGTLKGQDCRCKNCIDKGCNSEDGCCSIEEDYYDIVDIIWDKIIFPNYEPQMRER